MLRFEVALGGRDWLNPCNRNDLAFSLSEWPRHMEFRFEQHGRVLGSGNRSYVTRLGVVLSRIAVPQLPALKSLKGVGQHGFRPRAMTQAPVAEAIGGIHELGELESAGLLMLQDFMAATIEHGPGQDIPITHSEPGDLEDTVEMQAGVLSVTGWVERSSAVSLFGGSTLTALPKNTGLISYGFHRTISPWNQTASHTHDEEHGNEFWMLHGTQALPFYP